MTMIRKQITLKHWANDTHYFFSPNVSGRNAREELAAIRKKYPDYVELPYYCDTFRDCPESYGCDKIYVYGWYWRGSWCDPSKEIYTRLYKPKTA